jgi:hypothetical protein
MPRTHSLHPISSSPDAAHIAQLRSVIQGNLRALAIPPQAMPAAHSGPTPADEARVAPRQVRLGDYLRSHNLISEQDLAAALKEQRQRIALGQPIALGDLLVEQGLLSAHDLVTVLMLQQLDRMQGPTGDTAPPLGELLVQAGLITAEQLATALIMQTEARQRGETTQLGEILIAAGALSHDDLLSTLAHQHRSRR